MKTILFDTKTNQPVSLRRFNGGYNAEFPQATLPENIIELQVIETPAPQPGENHKAILGEWAIDLELKTYTMQWEIVPLTEYELAEKEWVHAEYSKRITAPEFLLMQFANVLTHFQAHGLPTKVTETTVQLWCNFIRPEHQSMIDAANNALEGTGMSIVINDIPEILS
jgi:hypothetical protein